MIIVRLTERIQRLRVTGTNGPYTDGVRTVERKNTDIRLGMVIWVVDRVFDVEGCSARVEKLFLDEELIYELVYGLLLSLPMSRLQLSS